MIVKGLTHGPAMLFQAAKDIGVECQASDMNQKGTSYRFTLKLGPAKLYQRTSAMRTNKRTGEPARVNGVCWHGHADFFRRLFELEPTAVISSSRMGSVTYRADNFERVYPETGYWNIGSQIQPCYFHDACDYSTHPVNRS